MERSCCLLAHSELMASSALRHVAHWAVTPAPSVGTNSSYKRPSTCSCAFMTLPQHRLPVVLCQARRCAAALSDTPIGTHEDDSYDV